mmetsp:Transcript_76717/g.197604  ORF Transcript_76717/g.197604 Transcript_76717/m.197604 type:complete len:263 (+) Transcript_76717:69-857(+)
MIRQKMARLLCLAACLALISRPVAFIAGGTAPSQSAARRPRTAVSAHWMDHLKWGGSTPSFDVIEKAKAFAAVKTSDEAGAFYSDDYIFRGSIIGPITHQDVADTQTRFNVQDAYPDLDRGVFGFTVDPENPYRCFFFERWTGTHTGEIRIGGSVIEPTGNRVETPLHMTSVTFNPEGKIAYQSISPPVDRFEGNTKGAGAVFGLLVGAGVPAGSPSVGEPLLILQQKFAQAAGFLGKQWSEEEDIPSWWKSSARGADPNDM